MKRNLLSLTLLLSVVTLAAQNRDKDPVIENYIARPGLTVIIFNDNNTITYDKHIGGDMYNYNDIYDPQYKSAGGNIQSIDNWFAQNKIGQRIVSYIFNRKEDGMMDDSILKQRGLYAATAEQKMDADATMLGSKNVLQDFGYEMLNNNYVLIITPLQTIGFNNNAAVLYKLELPNNFLSDNGLGKAWVLPTDDSTTRRAKIKAFNEINYRFKEIARVSISDIVLVAGEDKYTKIMRKIENKVSVLTPQSPVFSTNPTTARIGEKENLKNGSRYDSYKYVLRNGEVKAVRTAILRASSVANNTKDNTKLSEFTPIAGYGIKEGYILKQRRDLRSSITASYRIGAMEGYGINYDFLTKIKTSGASFTNGLYLYANSYDIMQMAGEDYDYILNDPDLFDSGNWTALSIGYRGANTWRIARFFETGFAYNFGLDIISIGDNYEQYMDDFYTSMVTFTPEVVFKINIAYPIHLLVSAGYTLSLYKSTSDSDYKEKESVYNSAFSVLDDLGAKRTGLTFSAGLSFSF